jgi:co-chaperonin GroES (HSP10)
MADQGIKPLKRYVLVKVLENEPEQLPTQSETMDKSRGVLAQVISAATETSVKAGQTVIMQHYAVSSGVEVSNMLFIEDHYIVALVA